MPAKWKLCATPLTGAMVATSATARHPHSVGVVRPFLRQLSMPPGAHLGGLGGWGEHAWGQSDVSAFIRVSRLDTDH